MRAIFSLFLLLLSFGWRVSLLAQTQTIYEDISWADQPDRLVFRNDQLSLEISKQNGAWLVLQPQQLGQNILSPQPALDFQVNGQWMVEKSGCKVLSYRVMPDPFRKFVSLAVELGINPQSKQEPAYRLTCLYTLFPHQSRLHRSAQVTRLLPDKDKTNFNPVHLEGFRFDLPGLVIGSPSACVVDVPGPFFPKTLVPPSTPYDSLLHQNISFHSAPDAGFGMVSLSNPTQGQTITAWMNTAGETNYRPYLKGNGERITFGHTNYRYYKLLPSLSVSSDVQQIEFTRDLPEALKAYRQMVKVTMPMDTRTPAWVTKMILLEVYPEYFPTGFKGITQKLPFYKEIGFNTLYLMPHWQGGYSPLNLFEVDPKYGTQADLQELVNTAHQLGMKVLFDMVIHGFNVKSPVVQQHPELFIKDETGKPALHPTWKSVSTDWASPAYQQYMIDLVQHDLKTYDIDGYRVDAASYKGPSWDPNLPYPAYRPGAAAPELMQKMLAALRKTKPESVLLSEVFGPVFYSVSNLAHDNQTEAAQLLLEKMGKGQYTAAQYKEHMVRVMEMLPRGANRVYFARNHDTSWFFHFNGYTPAFLALDAIHALFAIPEVFAGDPNNGPNPDDRPEIYAYYQKLFQFKKAYPEWTTGELKLREVSTDNSLVFTGARSTKDHTSLAVISLSNQTEQVQLYLQAALPKVNEIMFQDVSTGESVKASYEDGRFLVTLKPYQVLAGRIQ